MFEHVYKDRNMETDGLSKARLHKDRNMETDGLSKARLHLVAWAWLIKQRVEGQLMECLLNDNIYVYFLCHCLWTYLGPDSSLDKTGFKSLMYVRMTMTGPLSDKTRFKASIYVRMTMIGLSYWHFWKLFMKQDMFPAIVLSLPMLKHICEMHEHI